MVVEGIVMERVGAVPDAHGKFDRASSRSCLDRYGPCVGGIPSAPGEPSQRSDARGASSRYLETQAGEIKRRAQAIVFEALHATRSAAF